MTNLTELEQTCKACVKCPLCQSRTNVVFGMGDPRARLMFVGEGPGKTEDEQGLPFVGRAGKLLDDMLAAIGLDRPTVYIANIVKCRPPGNRDPDPGEQDACIGYLFDQIELIAPEIVVCLGRVAAARLIRKDFKITREHGVITDMEKYKIMAMYHPAFLLRDPRHLPETFEDLKTLERLLEANALTEGGPAYGN